ncbi:acyl-CoA-like ligand-binding transcription factor [Actinacidiphila alni]|uniref:acyl-CoA-like ligand-binding transcription factor n=1 Tax=Actinacidiphila alni TaxID=380248 RepID=UPI003452BBFC
MSNKQNTQAPSAPAAGGGLRERKKQRTRQTLRREAYRLFAEQGYEATTVDQIAEAAEVSASTFFRYFPAKEAIVLDDEYDPMLVEALRARPADEPVITSIRHALTDTFSLQLAADKDELLLRARLSLNDPVIRACSMDDQLRSQDTIAALIAERAGLDPDDLDAHAAAAAIVAVFAAVVRHWAERGGEGDLAARFDRQLGLLSAGLRI